MTSPAFGYSLPYRRSRADDVTCDRYVDEKSRSRSMKVEPDDRQRAPPVGDKPAAKLGSEHGDDSAIWTLQEKVSEPEMSARTKVNGTEIVL